ncbi:hypothetical protein [Arcobacter sp. F2176]|jgi:hypothetical protein|uniref:hypothetical protein n=1 Tax=Arcobacter sp. F2176 TaxID=2044511 RepID=UPI00100B49A3|nr:hypothetical protein [Arcobacter sp. F2176]RXJ82186.1 hypothetical protein CRU95_04675 [Arcobacter sp. F2176]
MEVIKQNISLSNRIEEAFNAKKLKQSDLVKKYDYLSSALINKFFNTQKTVTNHLIRLCIDENINLDWLCTGRGEMFITNKLYNKQEEKTSDLLVGSNLNSVHEPNLEYNSISNQLIVDIKKLSLKRQKYYYHRVKADLIDEES